MPFMDDGDLPFPKEELTPLSETDDPNKYLTHAEWNQVMEAMLDVRDHVQDLESAGGGVPTSRVITTTAPVRIDGGASANLSADRTLSVNAFTTGASGVANPSGAAANFLRGDNSWSTVAQVTAALDAFTTALQGMVPASGANANFLRGDGSWSTIAQVTAALDLFTSTLRGLVPASGGGTANFLRADGNWAAPVASFFDTILTPSAITFGAAFDNWNPGALGNVTLINCTTDGSSRGVRGLQGGSEGKIVCLLNRNSSVSVVESWAHEDGAATAANRFRNFGGAALSSGCIWYIYDGTNSRWSHMMGTQ